MDITAWFGRNVRRNRDLCWLNLPRMDCSNPTNGRAIRQMVRQGLITTDPQFRLMNESFRRFLRSAGVRQLETGVGARIAAEWLGCMACSSRP